jgi:hypothetical protein
MTTQSETRQGLDLKSARLAKLIDCFAEHELQPVRWRGQETLMGWVAVLPEGCRRVLAAFTVNNRKQPDSARKKIVDDMRSGVWVRNGESVVFDWNINLRDGHTRFEAGGEGGASVDFHVVIGVDPDVFLSYDQGSGRTFAQTLRQRGVPHATEMSAAVFVLAGFLNSGQVRRLGSAHPRSRRFALVSLWEKWRDRIDLSVDFAVGVHKAVARRVGGRANLAVLHLLLASADREKAERFLLSLTTNAGFGPAPDGPDPWQPARVLFNTLLVWGATSADDQPPEVKALAVVKAWNMMREGKPCRGKLLSAEPGEAFPPVSGWPYQVVDGIMSPNPDPEARHDA